MGNLKYHVYIKNGREPLASFEQKVDRDMCFIVLDKYYESVSLSKIKGRLKKNS